MWGADDEPPQYAEYRIRGREVQSVECIIQIVDVVKKWNICEAAIPYTYRDIEEKYNDDHCADGNSGLAS